MDDSLWHTTPQPGDLVLFARAGLVGSVISWATRSVWSHAGMIVAAERWSPAVDPVVIEVAPPRIERRLLSAYSDRAWWVLRPFVGAAAATLGAGIRVADRTIAGIGRPGHDYPSLDLLAHGLPRHGLLGRLRRRILQRGEEGVCSVVATAEWERAGALWYAWDGRLGDYVAVSPAQDGYAPSEIAHEALRGRLLSVGERPVGASGRA